jgi:hypothetical protein
VRPPELRRFGASPLRAATPKLTPFDALVIKRKRHAHGISLAHVTSQLTCDNVLFSQVSRAGFLKALTTSGMGRRPPVNADLTPRIGQRRTARAGQGVLPMPARNRHWLSSAPGGRVVRAAYARTVIAFVPASAC